MPWPRKASAVARPIPRAAPVIAAVSPARMRGCFAIGSPPGRWVLLKATARKADADGGRRPKRDVRSSRLRCMPYFKVDGQRLSYTEYGGGPAAVTGSGVRGRT